MSRQGSRGVPASRRRTLVAIFMVPSTVNGTVPQEKLAAEADVFPSRACCSWFRFFRGGAQTTRTGSSCFLWTGQPDPRDRTLWSTRLMNLRSIFTEKEAAKTGACG